MNTKVLSARFLWFFKQVGLRAIFVEHNILSCMLFETYAQSVELQNEYEETLVSKCYENQISSNACAFWLFHNTRNARYLCSRNTSIRRPFEYSISPLYAGYPWDLWEKMKKHYSLKHYDKPAVRLGCAQGLDLANFASTSSHNQCKRLMRLRYGKGTLLSITIIKLSSQEQPVAAAR